MPILVVQLGHCYRTVGATGTTGEQAYAAKVGNACKALLSRNGWQVRAILADDAANLYAGDAFVAIHCDGSTSVTARGASIGYRTSEGQAFGQAWKRAYAARGWSGFRPDNYTAALAQYYGTGTAVARGNRRAVILECGFRTNAEDRALLDGPGGPERIALSLGDALGIAVPVVPPVNPPALTVQGEGMIIRGSAAKFGTLAFTDGLGLTNFDAPTAGRIGNQAPPVDVTDALWDKLEKRTIDFEALRPLLESLHVKVNAGFSGLSDDEANVLAAIQGSKGELLTALASIDGSPSDEQIADLADKLGAQLGGDYNVTITRAH